MNTRSTPSSGNHPPASSLPAHHAFIKPKLPSWLSQAPASALTDFRDSLISSNQARHDLKALLDELKSPEDFARPLLREALSSRFFGLVNDENAILVREWKNHHLLGLIKTHARTTRQTLLEAALQNFEASEAEDGGMETGTTLYNVTRDREVESLASATSFAELCRTQDLGGKYLAHISSVLEPTSETTPSRNATEVVRLFRAQAQHAFGVALHIAYMRQQFTPKQHLQLNSLQRSGSHLDIQINHLTINCVVLPGVLVIQAPTISISFILYTPEDPDEPLRQYTSMANLQRDLAERLLTESYREFFNRLVPLQHQFNLLEVSATQSGSPALAMGGRIYTDPAHLKQPISLTPITTDVFRAIAQHKIDQIKSDARTLVVPTADADLLSRQKRLQSYIDLGKSLLFFAASFIPVVGEVLLVVTAAQLIGTVYEGFAAWSRNDSDEALNDLMDVVDSVALAAATAGAIKTAGFTANLIKVQVRNKGWRLWHSDMKPYRHTKELPEHLVANKQGLYQYEQRSYLKQDDHVHVVKRAPDGKQWELSHPTDPLAYAPPLLSNEVGGYRHLHETPKDWDDLKLIKRLGPDATNIKQPAVEPILLLSGVDKTALRQLHQEMVRPPPLLLDTVKHFNLEQEINDFNLARAEGTSVTPHSPLIQFHLLVSLPEWPANRALKIVDEQQQIVMTHDTGTAEIKISEARFRKGELLHAVEEQLPQAEFNRLMPTLSIDYFTKVENLAMRLETEAEQQKQRLLSLLNEPGERAITSAEKSIRAIIPELSKRHLEEMESTLSGQERQRLQEEKTLPPVQQWEAGHYRDAIQMTRLKEGLFLHAASSRKSVPLVLYILEQTPGWPASRKLDVYDGSHEGPLLGSIGEANASNQHVVIRQGELYAIYDAQNGHTSSLTDLPGAIERTLSESERSTILSQSGTNSLEQSLQKTGLSLMGERRAPVRAMPPSTQAAGTTGLPLDPAFCETTSPTGLTVRADGTYQSAPLPDGSYRYYIQDNQKYYQVKSDAIGWRLIDARSRFRAYQPYVRPKAEGGWEIDQAKGALPGGRGSPLLSLEGMDSSDEFESAHSSSEYESAEEGSVRPQYTVQELSYMRTQRSFQHSQNYRGIYDRANNGRYPLRDIEGRPMRIRHIQSQGKSLTSDTWFRNSALRPYIQWEGYENVARLYEDKLEVTTFTQAHLKFPQEASLIGQATVITRRPVLKGEALGVYGGELLHFYVARARLDPYLIPIKDFRPTSRYAVNMQLVLSGDNALSRVNTVFEYDGEFPVRQASTGYNVEATQFRVQTKTDDNPPEQLILTGLFASEDIPAGTELRWNYQYDESTIRSLFPRP
ncbi:dermonecrotic toxin domain-containing protein [Pseudomonas grimontii]|uniref:dermonecrotic toxin domain-containing protein n=1 Tax=Pseudomonas grimontii TaxID=129847 RepID=UPI00387B4BC7